MGNISLKVQLIKDRLRNIANATRETNGGLDLLYLTEIDDEILTIDNETHIDYDGEIEVTPSFYPTTLPTGGTALDEDITVKPIAVTTVENIGGGNTLII